MLEYALQKSLRAKIAVLCARPSSDPRPEGNSWRRHAITIAEAVAQQDHPQGSGQRHDEWEPFYFPGDAKIITTERSNNTDIIGGEAVATALATGLAATILRCCYLAESGQDFRQETARVEDFVPPDYGPEFMRKIFMDISYSLMPPGGRPGTGPMPIWNIFQLPPEMAKPTEEVDLFTSMSFISRLVRRPGFLQQS